MADFVELIGRLKEGNHRFVTGKSEKANRGEADDLAYLADGQEPFAVVLGCADSRVPVEVVFDQGLGDLFVVRVAGNVAEPTQIGSIEYAVEHLGVKLIVVLGHSNCGAVKATLDVMEKGDVELSENLESVVEAVRPAVEGMSPDMLAEAVVDNVDFAAGKLREVFGEDVRVESAHYDLETGEVEFLD